MKVKIFKAILIAALAMLGVASAEPCDFSRESAEEKVVNSVSDFNSALLIGMDTGKAVRMHYFMDKISPVDSKFGLRNFFLDATDGVPLNRKISYFAQDLESDLSFSVLRWHLGKIKVTDQSNFDESEIVKQEEFGKLFAHELTEFGLTEESLDSIGDLNLANLDFHEKFTASYTDSIMKNTDSELRKVNFSFLNKHTSIRIQNFEGTNYYLVENKIFTYKLAIKNCFPKIMYLNRNFVESQSETR